MEKTLLPSGLYDRLPPEARQETLLRASLLGSFESFGYTQVSPPLLEFEEGLLAGRGAALSQQTFRVMDPLSHRIMGFRPDMTMQVARIAATRLGNAPQPLRLSYAGAVLRVKGDTLRGERQFLQTGIELIGAPTPAADAEVILVAALALTQAGIQGLSVDVNLPGLLALLLDAELTVAQRDAIQQAILRKDAAALSSFSLSQHEVITALISKTGAAEKTLPALQALSLPHAAKTQLEHLQQVVQHIRAGAPQLAITIDALETRGFEYHHGVSFSLFASGVKNELGRGGRYVIDACHPRESGDLIPPMQKDSRFRGNDNGITATGATLYVGTLLRAAPLTPAPMRVWVPFGTSLALTHGLRDSGFVTIHGLEKAEDEVAEAQRLSCTHIYKNETVTEL